MEERRLGAHRGLEVREKRGLRGRGEANASSGGGGLGFGEGWSLVEGTAVHTSQHEGKDCTWLAVGAVCCVDGCVVEVTRAVD